MASLRVLSEYARQLEHGVWEWGQAEGQAPSNEATIALYKQPVELIRAALEAGYGR